MSSSSKCGQSQLCMTINLIILVIKMTAMNIYLHISLITYDYLFRINCSKWDYRVKEKYDI